MSKERLAIETANPERRKSELEVGNANLEKRSRQLEETNEELTAEVAEARANLGLEQKEAEQLNQSSPTLAKHVAMSILSP